MNKRIKELLIEAGVYECDVNDSEFVVPEEQKKFAALIVKECAEVAHCNFHVDGLTLGGIMKEHFGVEE